MLGVITIDVGGVTSHMEVSQCHVGGHKKLTTFGCHNLSCRGCHNHFLGVTSCHVRDATTLSVSRCSAQLAGKMSTSNGGGGEEDEDEAIDDDEILRKFQQSQLSQSRLSLVEFLSE